MRLTQGLFNLRAIEPRTEPLRCISNGECDCGRFRHMLLKLRQVYFVEGVGTCMVIDQVIRLFLVGYQRGHASSMKSKLSVPHSASVVSALASNCFSGPTIGFAALTTSLRPPSEKPVTRPMPASKITTPTSLSNTFWCALT